MTKEQEVQLKSLVKEKLVEQRNAGIKIGYIAATKSIRDILNDCSISNEEMLNKIRNFCDKPWGEN